MLGRLPDLPKGTYRFELDGETHAIEVPEILGIDCDRLFCEYLGPGRVHGNFRVTDPKKTNTVEIRLFNVETVGRDGSFGKDESDLNRVLKHIPGGLSPRPFDAERPSMGRGASSIVVTPRGDLAKTNAFLFVEQAEKSEEESLQPGLDNGGVHFAGFGS